jgi:hypothetical protein
VSDTKMDPLQVRRGTESCYFRSISMWRFQTHFDQRVSEELCSLGVLIQENPLKFERNWIFVWNLLIFSIKSFFSKSFGGSGHTISVEPLFLVYCTVPNHINQKTQNFIFQFCIIWGQVTKAPSYWKSWRYSSKIIIGIKNGWWILVNFQK